MTCALGETIVVRPGERIPMDGVVLTGLSGVNQAPITGESVPVDKQPGDEIFAGSINGQGALEVEVTRRAADNTIARLIRLVEEAQAQKAPAQRFVDRFAEVYTPAVTVLAALIAIVPPLIWGAPFWNTIDGGQGWLYRALTLLVVACPCALVISTPVSIISAISNAARHGVLIKGGAYLEAMSRVRAIAFDKTGTLTAGRPAVVTVRSVDCVDPTQRSVRSVRRSALPGRGGGGTQRASPGPGRGGRFPRAGTQRLSCGPGRDRVDGGWGFRHRGRPVRLHRQPRPF